MPWDAEVKADYFKKDDKKIQRTIGQVSVISKRLSGSAMTLPDVTLMVATALLASDNGVWEQPPPTLGAHLCESDDRAVRACVVDPVHPLQGALGELKCG